MWSVPRATTDPIILAHQYKPVDGTAVASISWLASDKEMAVLNLTGQVAVVKPLSLPKPEASTSRPLSSSKPATVSAKPVSSSSKHSDKSDKAAKSRKLARRQIVSSDDDDGNASDGGVSDDGPKKSVAPAKAAHSSSSRAKDYMEMEAGDDGDDEDDDDVDDKHASGEGEKKPEVVDARSSMLDKLDKALATGVYEDDVTRVREGDEEEAVMTLTEAQEAFQPGSTTRPTYRASLTQRYIMTWTRIGNRHLHQHMRILTHARRMHIRYGILLAANPCCLCAQAHSALQNRASPVVSLRVTSA